jgi:hypothetical protein
MYVLIVSLKGLIISNCIVLRPDNDAFKSSPGKALLEEDHPCIVFLLISSFNTFSSSLLQAASERVEVCENKIITKAIVNTTRNIQNLFRFMTSPFIKLFYPLISYQHYTEWLGLQQYFIRGPTTPPTSGGACGGKMSTLLYVSK